MGKDVKGIEGALFNLRRALEDHYEFDIGVRLAEKDAEIILKAFNVNFSNKKTIKELYATGHSSPTSQEAVSARRKLDEIAATPLTYKINKSKKTKKDK